MLVVLRQVNFYLVAGGLGLLQAKNIRVISRDKLRKFALIDDGADAIDVPGKESHKLIVAGFWR